MALLEPDNRGLYCAAGDFYLDPWAPVHRAVISHAHADHAKAGSNAYLASRNCAPFLRGRIGQNINLQEVNFGDSVTINGVRISLHPAGHIRGSAQIRVEHKGEVWVFTGDYKRAPDSTTTPFEPVPCDVLITECTFGLPVYRWPNPANVMDEINSWWAANQKEGRTSVVFAYALGKAQRVLAGLNPSIGPIYTHGSVERMTSIYRSEGVDLPETIYATNKQSSFDYSQGIVVAPTSARRSSWMRRFGDLSTGFASGWMMLRGTRRRRAGDRGFILSDHVDWQNLMQTIADCSPEKVYLTHGNTEVAARWLRSQGLAAEHMPTYYSREEAEEAEED